MKKVILCLAVVSVIVAVVSSAFLWNQPVTPNCVA